MQYITKKLMEGINLKFKKDPNLHIYDRNSKKYNILQIFVILFANKKYNKRATDITFLIIIKEKLSMIFYWIITINYSKWKYY